jgi:hypothetical protein
MQNRQMRLGISMHHITLLLYILTVAPKNIIYWKQIYILSARAGQRRQRWLIVYWPTLDHLTFLSIRNPLSVLCPLSSSSSVRPKSPSHFPRVASSHARGVWSLSLEGVLSLSAGVVQSHFAGFVWAQSLGGVWVLFVVSLWVPSVGGVWDPDSGYNPWEVHLRQHLNPVLQFWWGQTSIMSSGL